MGSIAKISGVALVPGVSRNRRLYTADNIGKAAKRMQERLADPDGLPIPMRTHHDAGDDTGEIVGRITDVSVGEDKTLRYKAELFDTAAGRDIAALATPKKAALRSVSIHGYWLGVPKQVDTAEGLADTADDLEIDAIDFTAFPGVVRALIDSPPGKAVESDDGRVRVPIAESMDANVTVVNESGTADIVRASPDAGYWIAEAKYSADDMKAMLAKGHAMKNAAGEPSYPIKDLADLKKAIKAVGRGKSDHDAIRKHIIKRAKALGAADQIPANWNSDGTMKESAITRMSEVREYWPDGPENPSGFCIDAYSGPLSVTVRGCVSPDELRTAATLAVTAAMDAIRCMDPDDDADIDADGTQEGALAGAVSPDDDMSDVYGESVTPDPGKAATPTMTEEEIRAVVAAEIAAALKLPAGGSPVATETTSPPDAETSEMKLDADDHTHTHEMDGGGHTHAHQHDHVGEGGFNPYSHGHTHTHVHASTDGPDHEHGHNHVHMTSSSATAENTEGSDNNMEESAMGDTQIPAAEAAPVRTFTDADMTALGETIGKIVGEAMRAAAETAAPKHAAATQETTETLAEEVAAESTTPKAADLDLAELKESLAKELEKKIRADLRAELLEEKGLPPRRGYRLTENDEEQEMTDAELFNNHRVDILLGAYAATPKPGDVAAA